MEEKNRRTTYTVLAILAVAALLFVCLGAIVVGGFVGLLAVRSRNAVVTERLQLPEVTPYQLPGNILPEMPMFPGGMMSAQGALIVSVVPGGPASKAGLQVGDVITAINQTAINARHPLSSVIAQFQPGAVVTVYYLRGNQQASLQATLGQDPNQSGRAFLGVEFDMIGLSGAQGPTY